MPRAEVTQSLAETIRSIRIRNKIKSKELANNINKSTSYISKLEKGEIRSIDTDELYLVLNYISKNEPDLNLADQIYKTLNINYSAKEIEDQLWFYNYDTMKCLLPIPKLLVDKMNNLINNLNITRNYLLFRINSNEALSEKDINDESIPFNLWYLTNPSDPYHKCIKIKISEKQINAILDETIDVAPYMIVFCILFYLLKIEKYQETTKIDDELYQKLMDETAEILGDFKFYSISEKNNLFAEKQAKDDINSILSSFDIDNIEIINNILENFQIATQQNIKSTNKQLKAFNENMDWDLGFMLKLIGLNYNCLKKTSVNNKKQLLSDIEQIIKKYESLSDEKNRLEIY